MVFFHRNFICLYCLIIPLECTTNSATHKLTRFHGTTKIPTNILHANIKDSHSCKPFSHSLYCINLVFFLNDYAKGNNILIKSSTKPKKLITSLTLLDLNQLLDTLIFADLISLYFCQHGPKMELCLTKTYTI